MSGPWCRRSLDADPGKERKQFLGDLIYTSAVDHPVIIVSKVTCKLELIFLCGIDRALDLAVRAVAVDLLSKIFGVEICDSQVCLRLIAVDLDVADLIDDTVVCRLEQILGS